MGVLALLEEGQNANEQESTDKEDSIDMIQ